MYDPDEIVSRARSHIGKGEYSLPVRNCEQLASWCYEGSAFSRQVDALGGTLMVAGIAFSLGAIAVGALAKVAARAAKW